MKRRRNGGDRRWTGSGKGNGKGYGKGYGTRRFASTMSSAARSCSSSATRRRSGATMVESGSSSPAPVPQPEVIRATMLEGSLCWPHGLWCTHRR